MKKIIILIMVLNIGLITVLIADNQPIQLALVNPIQLVNEENSISGLRLNIYGKNVSLEGIDFGIVNHLGKGNSTALQFGSVNFTEGSFKGVQFGYLVNVNQAAFEGFQGGFVNYTENMKGLQLGFVNYAGSMEGIQIGFINVIHTGGVLPIMPIINWQF